MNRLDRYVGKTVLGAFIAALAFFTLLVIIMDVLGNMPRYVRVAEREGLTTAQLGLLMLDYYVALLPVLLVSIIPFVTVIACMFALARLQHANEVVPMLFVGRPMRRVLRPMMLCGLFAAFGMAACWQWVVPEVAPRFAQLSQQLNSGSSTQETLVDESPDGALMRRLYVSKYEPSTETITGVHMLVEAVLAADSVMITADSGVWDEEASDWRLENGWRETVEDKQQIGFLGRSDLPPDVLLQVGRSQIEADAQSYTQLAETMARRSHRADVRLAFHRHITYPLANLILLMLALPLAIWFERGSRIERILMAIGLCGAYALFDLVCQSLGGRGYIHPVVAAWSPTIVFGSLGLVLFGGVRS